MQLRFEESGTDEAMLDTSQDSWTKVGVQAQHLLELSWLLGGSHG